MESLAGHGGGGVGGRGRKTRTALGGEDGYSDEEFANERDMQAFEKAPLVQSQVAALSMPSAVEVYHGLLSSYPLETRAITAALFGGLADILSQIGSACLRRKSLVLKYGRVLRLAACCFFLNGVCNHMWYSYLDGSIPGNGVPDVLKKVALDEFVYSLYSDSAFFVVIGMLEQRSWEHTIRRLQQEFIPTYLADLSIWPAAQIINFRFVPALYRVFYMNVVSLMWTCYLAGQAQKEVQPRRIKVKD
eukprot:tig00000241_g21012.t1